MRNLTIILLIGISFLPQHISIGQSTTPRETGKSKIHTLVIEDLENEGVLKRIGTTAGVTIGLTPEDVVSGKRALEVRVAPYSVHKNLWPYIYLVINPPLDLAHYSKISLTIRNVTEGLAGINVQGSTLPYNDGGRNFAQEYFQIPSGTSWVCDLPTANFIYLGAKNTGNQSVDYNDPSNVQLIQIVFPANEIHAVYRIDAIQAVYAPAVGSPAEKLKEVVETIHRQFSKLRQKINWKRLGESDRQSVEERYAQLGRTIEGLSQACEEGSKKGFQGHYTALKRDVDHASREFGALLLADKKDYYVWGIDPYINIFKDEAPDFRSAERKKIEIQMAQNEFRDDVFMVSACSGDIKLEVKVLSRGNLPPDAIVAEKTLYLKNTVGEEVGDAIYPLTGPLAIPRKESRQIRLRFDSRYTAIKPGRYRFSIQLRDLNTGIKKDIPGSLEVWGFRLPNYDILANNSYAMFDNCEFSSGELTAKAVAHMKMYGLNHVFIHPIEMPRPVVDADGDLLRFDSSAFENRVRWIQKGWQSVPGNERLTFMLGALIINEFGLDRPDVKYPTPKWKAIFPKWYAYLKATTRRLGIADEDLVMVLADEPNESAMINLDIPLAQAIKNIDPNIKITSNTSTVINDPAMSAKFFQLFDILQPHLPELKSGPSLLKWVRSSGKTLWTYKCLGGFSQKNKNPYEYYRVYGWDLVRYGLTGTGVWTYCAQGKNAWKNPDGGSILIFKHPTEDEVVHSRRYEMFREGIDDYRYIWKLRDVAKEKGPQAQAAAEKLIQKAIQDITSNVSDSTRCEKWRLKIAQMIETYE